MTSTNSENTTNPCRSPSCGCEAQITRRDVLKILGVGAAASALPIGAQVFAGPFSDGDVSNHLIPVDKKLMPEWIASLTQHGQAEFFTGEQLQYVGMPVGGIGCGQLYLGGDGRLWLWDIFKCNYQRESDHGKRISAFTLGGHYAHPVAFGEEYTKRNGADVAQGFLIRAKASGKTTTRTLDRLGFPKVSFRGEYPIGKVTYRDEQFPAEVRLEAFSPFIPLNAKDSALPATVMSYTVTNTSVEPIEIDLGGWMQNATCPYQDDASLGTRNNDVAKAAGMVSVVSTISPPKEADYGQSSHEIETRHGYGSTALSLLHDPANQDGITIGAAPSLTGLDNPEAFFKQMGGLDSEAIRKPLNELLVGGLSAQFDLNPGESKTIDYVISWYFPDYNEKETEGPRNQMLTLTEFDKLRRHYAPWFDSAEEVAAYISKNNQRLLGGTRDWNKTWYDSTLPYWLLDRSFIPIDCLASQMFHWFDSGRPYGWEGVDCCTGTCTHVWHYAQALGRIFPELERAFREKVDFKAGVGFNPDSGMIFVRGDSHRHEATDGQAGTILRAYREHQMSKDDAFLKRLWPNIRKAIEFLIRADGDGNGLLEGKQPHTLDAAWHGPMGWLSGIYLAALAAGEAMAVEMRDEDFATECRTIIDRGSRNIVAEVFDGEYFIHKPDPAVKDALNTNKGCHIDQVLGQAWVRQVGLGRVIPKKETVSALNSLWKYNFAPDAGGYAMRHREIEKAFRWYAMEGEAGLLMCTWPKGGALDAIPGQALRPVENPEVWTGPGGYFNECMNGFEYQVAAHMVYEGEPDSDLVEKGLAITKAVHERYGSEKRNPYNEIECSDHYARSMASYGVFLAACGFEYHGPKGRLGFAPRINPDDFKAPFTTAEGWGSFSQKVVAGEQIAGIELRYGQLVLKEFALDPVKGTAAKQAKVELDGRAVEAAFKADAGRYILHFAEAITLSAGQKLVITCAA